MRYRQAWPSSLFARRRPARRRRRTRHTSAKPSLPKGQVMRYISGSEPESLDPQVSTGQPEARIYLALLRRPHGIPPGHRPSHSGASPSAGSRTATTTEFTFHLRRNARWSNGDPITARDFVYSAAPRPRRPRSPRAPHTSRITSKAHRRTTKGKGRAEDVGIEAVDDYTLKIRLTQPVPFLTGLVAHQFFRLVPQKAIEKYGDAWTRPENIVTCGAFKVADVEIVRPAHRGPRSDVLGRRDA